MKNVLKAPDFTKSSNNFIQVQTGIFKWFNSFIDIKKPKNYNKKPKNGTKKYYSSQLFMTINKSDNTRGDENVVVMDFSTFIKLIDGIKDLNDDEFKEFKKFLVDKDKEAY